MIVTPPLFLAEVAHPPLFGNQWLALLAILAGVAVFMAFVAAVGHWLAATHPESPRKPGPIPSLATPAIEGASPEILAVIAAAVTAALGTPARIASVRAATPAPSVEVLMQQWSLEGRRQIYSSHQFR